MSALPDHDILTRDSSMSAVIAAYTDAEGAPGERRQLRSALGHVEAELGTRPIRAVRARHVVTLLDDLRAAGLSPRRRVAVTDALHGLFAFAVARGLVDDSPIPARRREWDVDSPAPSSRAEEPRTPTLTMLALGARVAWWTAMLVTIGFAVLALGLIVELA